MFIDYKYVYLTNAILIQQICLLINGILLEYHFFQIIIKLHGWIFMLIQKEINLNLITQFIQTLLQMK